MKELRAKKRHTVFEVTLDSHNNSGKEAEPPGVANSEDLQPREKLSCLCKLSRKLSPTSDSSQTSRQQWSSVSKVLRGNYVKPSVLYPAKFQK